MTPSIAPIRMCRTAPPNNRTGFTFVEILLAIGLLSLIAVSALHSRVIIVRAEHKARRMDEARLLMRGLVAGNRAGMERDGLRDNLPEHWLWTETETPVEIIDPENNNSTTNWLIWRLEHHADATALEIIIENSGRQTGKGSVP